MQFCASQAFAFTGATFLIMGFVDSCNIVNIPTLTEAGWTKDLCYEVSANWMKAVPRRQRRRA